MFRTCLRTSTFPKVLRKNNPGAEKVPVSRASSRKEKESVLPGTYKPDTSARDDAQPYRRILGIDPGLASCGYGVIDYRTNRYVHVCHGVVETPSGWERPRRLLYIFSRFEKIIEECKPDCAGMELLYFAKNVTSGLAVAEARGVITLALARRDVPLAEYSPLSIKQAVAGSSRAGKRQVQEFVRLLLGLENIPEPDHAADALAAAITRIHSVF